MVLSHATTNTQFLKIPHDSHIVDVRKDCNQTAHMRFFICVFVVRNTYVRNIYSRYGSFIIPFAEVVTVTLIKDVYHRPGHVIADMLAYVPF